jgi:competence protein ComGD
MRQKKKIHKQAGFTILEVLIVLSISVILLSISVPLAHHLLQQKTEEKVLNTFLYDILYLQNQSLITEEQYLRLALYKKSYTIVGINNETIERQLPIGWEIDRRTLSEISFNSKGSIRKAGTIQIITPQNKYNVVFPLGKGRGYIEKQ